MRRSGLYDGRVRTLTLDATGANVDWAVRQNCLWTAGGQIRDDGVPVPLTGATITAVITANALSTTVLKAFNVNVYDVNEGLWSITVDEADATLAPGRYWWAMEIDFGAGNEPLCSGSFIVEPWVVVSP